MKNSEEIKSGVSPLTGKPKSAILRQMQTELASISVKENVDARLDRIFERAGILYKGDYRAFFEDLDAMNDERSRELDSWISVEDKSCRLNDDEAN